jgi:hypothetical protein
MFGFPCLEMTQYTSTGHIREATSHNFTSIMKEALAPSRFLAIRDGDNKRIIDKNQQTNTESWLASSPPWYSLGVPNPGS